MPGFEGDGGRKTLEHRHRLKRDRRLTAVQVGCVRDKSDRGYVWREWEVLRAQGFSCSATWGHRWGGNGWMDTFKPRPQRIKGFVSPVLCIRARVSDQWVRSIRWRILAWADGLVQPEWAGAGEVQGFEVSPLCPPTNLHTRRRRGLIQSFAA